jgi:hypothetical protein
MVITRPVLDSPQAYHPLAGLEFITNRFDSLSLSPEGNDSGAVFVGIVHSGSPSLHTILKESVNKDDTTSSGWGGGEL